MQINVREQRRNISLFYPFLWLTLSLFVYVFSYVSFTSCSSSAPDGGAPGNDPDNSYFVANANAIGTEFASYKFRWGERRPVYAAGKIPSNGNLYTHAYIWWKDPITAERRDYSVIPTYFNGYYDSQTKEYTVPLTCDIFGLTGSSYSFTVVVGDTGFNAKAQTTFGVNIVSTRNYDIEYNNQQGYDLFSRGYNMDFKLKDAFAGPGTDIIKTAYASNLAPDSVRIVTDNVLDEYLEYAYTNASGGWSHNQNIALLYGIRNFVFVDSLGRPSSDPEVPNSATGVSIAGPGGYSFVMVERIEAIHPPGDQRKKDFDRTVIHELGHQRGITGPHSLGHNGENKKYCVMLQPAEITPDQVTKILDNPVYCEGHKQRLYNIVWSQFVQ